MKLKELREKRQQAYVALNELRTQTAGRQMTAEERASWDASTNDYSNYDQQIADEEQLSDMERRMLTDTQKRVPSQNEAGDEEYRSAYIEYLADGVASLSAESRSVLSSRASLTGGLSAPVLVPSTMENAIERALKDYGGVLSVASLITTTTGADLVIPTVNNTSKKATIIAEYGQSGKESPQFDSVTLGSYTYRTPIVPISQELLQDNAFNVESVVGELLGESFARGINESLTIGSGTKCPQGIVTAATASSTKALSSGIVFDDLLGLYKEVDPAYSSRGKWMMNQNTLIELMKIKDNDGRYIFTMSPTQGAPSTIWGREYQLNSDMADIGAGACSVIFGDLSKYRVRMVKGFTTIRLNELLAEYLSIGIMGFGRLDGKLIDAGTNPIKKLVHATA